MEIDQVFGTSMKCLQDFVLEGYGQEEWKAVLEKAGLPSDKKYHSIRFYPDVEFTKLVDACSEEFHINGKALLRDLGKVFGKHLISVYSTMFLKEWKSLDVIEKVAPKVFTTIQFIDPYTPRSRVTCSKIASDEVVVYYRSPRKMCVYICGIIEAVGEHFKEKLKITELTCMLKNDEECQIHVKLILSST